MEHVTPFQFMECATILRATGKRARNIREFRRIIDTVSEGSLFHHTCQYFLKGHVLEYTNDFAQWVGESLEERALSEYLSNVDPFAVKGMAGVREELTARIDRYLEEFPEPRPAMAGDEFYFNESVSLIFPSGVQAWNLAEFLIAMKYVDRSSIYYHFYEARVRHESDDFSTWIDEVLEDGRLAKTIRAIDPFMYSIESIRTQIGEAVQKGVERDMEVIGP